MSADIGAYGSTATYPVYCPTTAWTGEYILGMDSRKQFDVVVLGSGAGGLSAALAAAQGGAQVAIFEKADLLGGSTAISGGVPWFPCNHHQDELGIDDSPEQALAYLSSLSLGRMDPQMAQAFVDGSRQTCKWLEDSTSIRFSVMPGYPDYHPEHPGGMPAGGRSLDPNLFSYRELGVWADKIAKSRRSAHLKITDTTLGGGTGYLAPEVLAQREAEDLRGCGAALVGPLLKALLDAEVSIFTGAAATDLILTEGRVTGVQVTIEGTSTTVVANKAVILATGGFEWNTTLVSSFLRGPMDSPAGVPTNEGDGLLMAMRAGAQLANMGQAWWVPTVTIPGDVAFGQQRANLVNRERTLPGSIFVNRKGKRFTNEAANYNALGGAFHQMDPVGFDYPNLPCWLIFDQQYATSYGSFGTKAGEPIADWIARADTLSHLAQLIGVDPEGLGDTVTRWNATVAAGHDEDFGRGDSAYDRWSGDGDFRFTKQSTLGPITTGPFYAVEIHSGTLGTSGGPRTDTSGRVLNTYGDVIPGLFAVGNVAAAPTAMAYGGAGGTLGPILVFGRAAGMAASQGTA